LAPAAALDEPVHNGVRSIEILYGFRALDEDDWEPVDQQTAIGLMFAMQGEDAIIGFETGLMLSFDEDEIGAADVDATLGEIYVGAHRTFGTSAWFARPYVGAGVSLIRAALEIDAPGNDVDDDDSSVGFYAHGGVAFRLGDSLSLGVDGRFLGGTDLELFGGDTDVDYLQLGVFLGIDI
jgi:opacity protein-like surface antigen